MLFCRCEFLGCEFVIPIKLGSNYILSNNYVLFISVATLHSYSKIPVVCCVNKKILFQFICSLEKELEKELRKS